MVDEVVDGGDAATGGSTDVASGELFLLDDLATLVGGTMDVGLATLVRIIVTGLVDGELAGLPDPIPPGVTAVSLMVASRLYDNPTQLNSESFAGYSAGYGSAQLTPAEVRLLRRAAAVSNGLALSVQLDY